LTTTSSPVAWTSKSTRPAPVIPGSYAGSRWTLLPFVQRLAVVGTRALGVFRKSLQLFAVLSLRSHN